MTDDHTVKPTIISHPGILEQISVVPWGIALVLLLITFILPFPNQVSSWAQPSSEARVSSAADVYDQVRNICIEDPQSLDQGIPLTEPDSQGPPISLGCKLRDCGPSSTKPGPIEMQLRLISEDVEDVVDAVLIEFTNLPSTDKQLIKDMNTDTSMIGHDGSIRIPRGKPVSLQIPKKLITDGTSVDKNLTIKATLLLNKPLLQKHRGSSEFNQLQRHTWTAKLEIDQLKERIVVNEFKAQYRIRWCPSTQPQFDQIKLRGAGSKLRRVGLVNGLSEFGCLTYQSFVGTDTLHIDNLLGTSTECPSNEIVVFSPDRAMYIGQTQNWTEASGEIREVQLPKKLLQVPVDFWILHKPVGPDGKAKDIKTITEELKRQLETANELFGPTNMCGIEFVASKENFHDVTEESEPEGLSGAHCEAENLILFQNLTENKPWYNPESVNVYYSSITGAHGITCDTTRIFIGEQPTEETLAHEFGHVLGLGHYAERELGNAALTKKNLMYSRAGGSLMRTVLTQGQCFRCIMNPTTVLRRAAIKNAVLRLGAIGDLPEPRDCASAPATGRNEEITKRCVDIGLHVTTSRD